MKRALERVRNRREEEERREKSGDFFSKSKIGIYLYVWKVLIENPTSYLLSSNSYKYLDFNHEPNIPTRRRMLRLQMHGRGAWLLWLHVHHVRNLPSNHFHLADIIAFLTLFAKRFCPCFAMCQSANDAGLKNGNLYCIATLCGFGCCSLMLLGQDVEERRGLKHHGGGWVSSCERYVFTLSR